MKDEIMALADTYGARRIGEGTAKARAALESAVEKLVAENERLKDTLQDVRGHYVRVCTERDELQRRKL